MKEIKYYFMSGIMIAFGIAFVIASVEKAKINPLYAFGIFFGGLFIGIGLLPFNIREGDRS